MIVLGLACQAPSVSVAWSDRFNEPPGALVATGRNPFFILEPGHSTTLEDGHTVLVISVLPESQYVDGVWTRVVEERETVGGDLKEVSRNFFAISKRTGNVYYFGEDVDIYESDSVTSHDGAWRSGADSARFGLMMPSVPLIGARYHQEMAPGVAMDRAEVETLTDTLTTPAGHFEAVLRLRETTPLEPAASEAKYYAPGVGLIKEGTLLLTRVSRGGGGGAT